MRSGKDYVEALRDDRVVYVDGSPIDDVTTHPATAGVVETVAGMYDYVMDPGKGMVYHSPEIDGPANVAFSTPRSKEELGQRHQAIARWAGLSKGFLGRSPDHVAGFLAGFASNPGYFDRDQHPFGQYLGDFYRRVLADDLFVSYVIVPPQVSRATTAHGWEGDFIQVGVVEEREDGIVVRGSQMLGTSSAVSDWILVSCLPPLQPEDEEHALTFVVPVAAPGVKLYARRPYALNVSSEFDYPLSSRFDETDSLVVFDDVFVPWEQVFVFRDVEAVRGAFFETPAHVLGNNQAQIRLSIKMRFLIGVARKIAEVNEIAHIPAVQMTLADLASLTSIVEGMVIASETTAVPDGQGVMKPNPRFLYAAMGLQAETYPRAVHLLRELAGGGVIQLPSSYRELIHPDTRADMERYVQSPSAPTEERVKLFRLAWDIVGSEFGGRHTQYEMFYAGAPFVAKGYAYRNYGYDAALAEVNEFLGAYDLESATPED